MFEGLGGLGWEDVGISTVADKDYSFLLGTVFGLGDVGLYAADFIDAAGGLAGVEFSGEAAGAHSDFLRHFD